MVYSYGREVDELAGFSVVSTAVSQACTYFVLRVNDELTLGSTPKAVKNSLDTRDRVPSLRSRYHL